MEKLTDAARAALLAIAGGHVEETTLHEASIFQHAGRLAGKRAMGPWVDGKMSLTELARRSGEDDSVAIFAEEPEAARERPARFRHSATEAARAVDDDREEPWGMTT